MASCFLPLQCDSLSEEKVSGLEYNNSLGVGERDDASLKCGARSTDAASQLDDDDVRPDNIEHNTGVEFDGSSKKRARLHFCARRDNAKRSRVPFTPDMCPRQARGRVDRPDGVFMQAVCESSESCVDDEVDITLEHNSCMSARGLLVKPHVDISGFGRLVDHSGTSWRDDATDSLSSCILSSGEPPGLGMRCQDMGAVRNADSAWATLHTEYEPDKCSSFPGDTAAVNTCNAGNSGTPDHIDEPVLGLKKMDDSVQKPPCYPLLGELLCPLERGCEEFQDVERKFLGGLAKFSSDTVVTGISRDSSPRGHARLQAFKRLEEATKMARGDANVRFAWHGTSKTGVSGIFLHGFGQPRTPKNGCAYGVGVYLAPEGQSHVSAVYSDNDENGIQHVVLCKVILGSSELVKRGSEQFHPSSEEFDTGVDDLANPKRLIIWSTHMNTFILPVYVVSFKLPPRWHQMMAAFHGKRVSSICNVASVKRHCIARKVCQELKDEASTESFCKQGPTSPAISFPNLFLLLTPLLAPDRLQCLRGFYEKFQAKRLLRSELIQYLRDEVGDHRLLYAIKLLQGSQISEEQEQVKMKLRSDLKYNRLSSQRWSTEN